MNTIKRLLTPIVVVAALCGSALLSAPVHAQTSSGVLSSSTAVSSSGAVSSVGAGTCGDSKTEFIQCDSKAGLGAIGDLIKIAVFVVTILIGVTAVGAIAYAAILYAGARDNRGQVEQAMTIIRNTVIGLIMYGLTVAIVNWLIPQGVIG